MVDTFLKLNYQSYNNQDLLLLLLFFLLLLLLLILFLFLVFAIIEIQSYFEMYFGWEYFHRNLKNQQPQNLEKHVIIQCAIIKQAMDCYLHLNLINILLLPSLWSFNLWTDHLNSHLLFIWIPNHLLFIILIK